MVNVCVWHFHLYNLPKSKCEYPVSGLVWIQPEQFSAVTDSSPEQWQLDRTITIGL